MNNELNQQTSAQPFAQTPASAQTPAQAPAQTPASAQGTAHAPSHPTIAEQIVDNGQVDSADTLTFSDDVIEKIAGDAAAQAEGVAGLKGGFINRVQETFGAKTNKGVAVEVEEDGSVALYISVVMRFGYYAPDVFEDVKERVLKALSTMTGLQISSVNLRIEDIALNSETSELDARNS